MKFLYLFPLLSATLTSAAVIGGIAPGIVENPGKEGGCVPASCASFGCCSGNCGYWCRACGIDYTC